MNRNQCKQLLECQILALAHLETMADILERSNPVPYALCQQVDVATHKVRRIEIGEPSESTTTPEPG